MVPAVFWGTCAPYKAAFGLELYLQNVNQFRDKNAINQVSCKLPFPEMERD